MTRAMLALLVVLLAACGEDVAGQTERPSDWTCACTFTCWPGDEVFPTSGFRWVNALPSQALDAGPKIARSCQRQLADSGLCGDGSEHAVDVECSCACRPGVSP